MFSDREIFSTGISASLNNFFKEKQEEDVYYVDRKQLKVNQKDWAYN